MEMIMFYKLKISAGSWFQIDFYLGLAMFSEIVGIAVSEVMEYLFEDGANCSVCGYAMCGIGFCWGTPFLQRVVTLFGIECCARSRSFPLLCLWSVKETEPI